MEEYSMTAKETARLAEWLEAKGFTAEEIVKCIKYIAGTQEPEE